MIYEFERSLNLTNEFLKKKGLYKRFWDLAKESHENNDPTFGIPTKENWDKRYSGTGNIILRGFLWICTREGHDFWEDLSHEYLQYRALKYFKNDKSGGIRTIL